MNNDNVWCCTQTLQHVLIRYLFRNLWFDASVHQIELVIVSKNPEFAHVFHAAQRLR